MDFDEDSDEEMGPPELEVEEKVYYFGERQESKLLFKIYLQEDDDEFRGWMRNIHISCSIDGQNIGNGLGRFVKRNRIRRTFWRSMEEPCEELASIAFDLFNRYGRLKQEYIDHTIRKGSGVWGSELDLGHLFVIESVSVNKDWRGKGVGKRIVTELIGKSRAGKRTPAFTILTPSWLNNELEPETRGKTILEKHQIETRVMTYNISFYRALGFRRIGASDFFGLATDPGHPAHRISATDDFDPVEPEPDLDEEPDSGSKLIADLFGDGIQKRLKLLQERLPLHHALATLSDEECVEYFQKLKTSNVAVNWVQVDRLSKNVLHVAAAALMVKSVRWLLENVNDGDILSSARNIEGYTPQEELELQIDSKRATSRLEGRRLVISDEFAGFPPDVIGCLVALRASNHPSPIQYAQLKFGCTCGLCIDGFLSPRMNFALLFVAEMTYDQIMEDVESDEMTCLDDGLWEHVPPSIKPDLGKNESLRRGFANIFLHIATALRADKTPTALNIEKTLDDSSEQPPYTKGFLERGGKFENALHAIFEFARDEDEWAGDGSHKGVFGTHIEALPECRNDHEFGFVALACGIEL
ncbi:hypothetical protein ABW20_dc0102301 [Dactylellina cionopaga]|nr:hypothetical protein ABW20_dc0102301 [Dactylellina cionopaga]